MNEKGEQTDDEVFGEAIAARLRPNRLNEWLAGEVDPSLEQRREQARADAIREARDALRNGDQQ